MIDFKTPTLGDKGWADALLQAADYRGCEYNFTNLFTWKDAYHHALARMDGFLLVRLCGGLGCSYLYPAGQGDLRAVILALEAEAQNKGEPLRLVCLTGRQIAELEAAFPGEFEFTPDRDGFDYLYEIDHLADLKGKQLHAKRNHVNHFLGSNPGWVYEEVSSENLGDCLRMDEEWYRRNREREGAAQAEDLGNEGLALRLAIRHFETLGLEGGLLRVFGEVVAFTMGDLLSSDTFDVHFEKAYSDLRGAYATINQQFSAWVRQKHPNVRYLNREDDMGVAGLRTAKNSYYPDLMIEKHSAVRKSRG
ncbi:MAG: phosphatidylglycerol lysyltransferase domain-containing protein [Pseudoflavonifractor sp.]